jgi:serine/threonine protein kinase
MKFKINKRLNNKEIEELLGEIKKNTNEIKWMLQEKGNEFFIEAREFLNQSREELSKNNIPKSRDFSKMAVESAHREEYILDKIGDIEALLRENLTGSNPEESRDYIIKARKLLGQGKIDDADEIVAKAKIAAQPSVGYLLQKAREYYSQGLKSYETEKFTEAIEIWNNAHDEYKRARKIAKETKDEDMIKNIDSAVSTLTERIKDAEISFDNREMVKFDDRAIANIEKAKKLVDQIKYDDAFQVFDSALEDTKHALDLAKKRKFQEDKKRINSRIKDIEKRKQFYQIEKGKYLLQEAIKMITEKPETSETNLYDLLKYLETLKIDSEELAKTIMECKKAIIQSKLEQTKKHMEDAEKLYGEEKYYDARTIYEQNQDFLSKVEDEAGQFSVASIIEDIRKLRTMCIENRDSCNSQLFNLPDAPGRKLLKTKDLQGFSYPQPMVSSLFPTEKNVINKLRESYELLEHVGSGGFADVYKVQSKSSNAIEAIKIPRELTSASEEIFFKEIRNWEQLKHRNIVRLIRPRVRPIPHIVIEYINGKTLHDLLQEPKIDVRTACKIAFDMASGLEYAHSKSIIHCDLKPKNILISDIGEAKITDFGIARTVSATSTGYRGRTLIYASPEQIKGTPSTATDVYQVGLVLYQMLTGVNPFDVGSIIDVEKAIVEKVPQKPSEINGEIKPLDDMIMSCLSKNIDARPSIHAVRIELYEYMKRYHGESLHLTKSNRSYVKLSLEHAFFAAKMKDISECIINCKFARDKVYEVNMRKKLDTLIQQLEAMATENLPLTDSTIEQVGMILREIG